MRSTFPWLKSIISHSLLAEQASSKAKFKNIMEETEDMFKEGYENLFDKLQHHEIPALLHCIGGVLICQTSVIQMDLDFYEDVAFLKHVKGNKYTYLTKIEYLNPQ